ncbi:hypothetical protein D6T64_10465 [Cryobacterium melibiosiphilum]|uniref:Uncharacterized protein n=1 Tax=Cryobacterium melibiosiphilum TaxID=995039 RepID=A0A3A5MI48_9MICO|nr:hypothetical protein [Cryobacterium melibiosiphilum]RJT88541.1 hypothetical protein D6T64_10465 [Cryobacterium melibiosiphilum]
MTRQIAVADYSIVLPGTWAQIPLASREAASARISALVKRQVGMNDRLARHRRDVRDQLLDAALQAQAAHAVSFAISLELAPGVPFPASMLGSRASWPPQAADAATAGDRAATDARLRGAFPGAAFLAGGGGLVARQAGRGSRAWGEATTQSLSLDYWLPVPDGSGLLQFTISAPMVEGYELFTELFDTIVATVRWEAAAPVGSAATVRPKEGA